MASVNFEKIKSIAEIKAKIRHCDREEREKHEHKNKQINKNLTHKNIDLFDNDNYEKACSRFDKRLADLDNTTNTNKRKDRVNCFGLSIPLPQALSPEHERLFYSNTYQIICNQYGKDNIIAGYIHYDEVHDYIDASTNRIERSRPHFHLYVIPERNGILNGKWFSSKANMTKLNKSIDEMCQQEFHICFMTRTKKRGQSVEDLKEASTDKLFEWQNKLDARESDLNAREATLRQQEDYIRLEREKLSKERSEASKAISECKTLADEMKDERQKKRVQQVANRYNIPTDNRNDYDFHR